MRPLRPDRFFDLPAGLWVLDAAQPVAVVLDDDGRVAAVHAWPHVPPPPTWHTTTALSDGDGLWVQNEPGGALLRVTDAGPGSAAWTDQLELAATGPRQAWCAPSPPRQDLVRGAHSLPARWSAVDRLLRVDADGGCTPTHVDGRVRRLRTGHDTLFVEVDTEQWSLRHLGVDTFEVLWQSRWMALPWDAPVPLRLTAEEHGCEPPQPTALVAQRDGRDGRSRRRLPAAALLPEVSEHCWPLVPRPAEVDSYLAQQLAAFSRQEDQPVTEGVSDVRLTVEGDWPDAHLQWDFAYAPRPGLRLRRRVPLFDDLGRLAPDPFADVWLMETLDTKDLPPEQQARDGVLEI